jgi:hypothetical protein
MACWVEAEDYLGLRWFFDAPALRADRPATVAADLDGRRCARPPPRRAVQPRKVLCCSPRDISFVKASRRMGCPLPNGGGQDKSTTEIQDAARPPAKLRREKKHFDRLRKNRMPGRITNPKLNAGNKLIFILGKCCFHPAPGANHRRLNPSGIEPRRQLDAAFSTQRWL